MSFLSCQYVLPKLDRADEYWLGKINMRSCIR